MKSLAFNFNEIAQLDGVRSRSNWPELDRDFSELSTDTRKLEAGMAFLALRGERFDAADYLDRAEAAGAALIIADQAVQERWQARIGCPCLWVESPIAFYAELAKLRRRRLAMSLL
ncbi:MAG: Mur ligase domain-containing protein, partial [Eubacteriales bacterium]|nr:Mur ligase domain-containing protein [Eubacteriales bacterium]